MPAATRTAVVCNEERLSTNAERLALKLGRCIGEDTLRAE